METRVLPQAQPATGNTTHTQPENRMFFPALDGIRALAFLLVFFHHYVGFKVGWVGVDIFFVLSGFLITGILVDTRDTPHRVRNFYVRRSLRIFPLYYLVALLVLAAAPFLHWQWDWRWLAWPLYLGNWVLAVPSWPPDTALTNLNNGWLYGRDHVLLLIGHFWSLCVEEQFYLVWPWIVFRIRSRKTLAAIAAAVVVVCPLLRQFASHFVSDTNIHAGLVDHNTVFRIDTLMVGALIALIYRGPNREKLLQYASRAIWIGGAFAVLLVTVLVLSPAFRHSGFFKPYLFTVVALLSGVLITRSLVPGSLLFRVFSLPALRWMGRITYGAYIFHDLPHVWYLKLSQQIHLPVWLIGLAFTFLLAWLSFRFFESKFLDLKERFTA